MLELASTPIFWIPEPVFLFHWRFLTRQRVVTEIFAVCSALENKGNFWFNMVDDYIYLPLLGNPLNVNNSKNINAQGQRELTHFLGREKSFKESGDFLSRVEKATNSRCPRETYKTQSESSLRTLEKLKI